MLDSLHLSHPKTQPAVPLSPQRTLSRLCPVPSHPIPVMTETRPRQVQASPSRIPLQIPSVEVRNIFRIYASSTFPTRTRSHPCRPIVALPHSVVLVSTTAPASPVEAIAFAFSHLNVTLQKPSSHVIYPSLLNGSQSLRTSLHRITPSKTKS